MELLQELRVARIGIQVCSSRALPNVTRIVGNRRTAPWHVTRARWTRLIPLCVGKDRP